MTARTPADVDRIFAAALSAGDVEGALAMYEPDAVYQGGAEPPRRGHDEIRDTLTRLVALNPTLTIHEVDVLENGDLAVLRARWTFTGIDPETDESMEQHGRSIEVVRRQPDGSWKFTIDLPSGAS